MYNTDLTVFLNYTFVVFNSLSVGNSLDCFKYIWQHILK